jgi:hypothetical protein
MARAVIENQLDLAGFCWLDLAHIPHDGLGGEFLEIK